MRDLRLACRQLSKSPGFTVIAILTLALGITVNGIVFSFASEFFLRPLHAQDPGRLVVVAQKAPVIDYQIPFSYPDAVELRRMLPASPTNSSDLGRGFSDFMAYCEQSVHLSRSGLGTERAWVHAVTDNYFSLLGTQPECGRLFLPEEVQKPGAERVLVLTHDTWRSRFGADPAIIGSTLKLNGTPFTVIGVAQPGFVGASWGSAINGFIPVTMLTELVGPWALNPGNTTVFLMGRLQPATTLRQARAAMDVAMARLVQANPGNYLPNVRAVVMPEPMSRPTPYISHQVPAIIAALGLLSLLVLIIAGANVASLLYAHAASREYEFAIHSALGASRARLLRRLLAESVLIALGAGLVGVLASRWLMPVVVAALPSPSSAPPPLDTGADWRLFVFAFLLSLATGLLAGLGPALKATGVAVQPLLKVRSGNPKRTRLPGRSLLVVGQVAVSCVVLIAAGLTVRSLHHLLQARLGFEPRHLMLASFDLDKQRYQPDRGRQFQTRLLEKVRALPGVRSASLADATPLDTRISFRGGVLPEGQAADARLNEAPVASVMAEHTLVHTLGFPLVAGREFTAQDAFGAPLVAVVNEALASRFWPGQSPLGKRINVQGDLVEVVGLVGETRYDSIRGPRRPLLIQPLAQHYRGGLTLIVRTDGATVPLAPALQELVRNLDPDLPLFGLKTMEQQIASSPSGLLPYRFGAALATGQGLAALFLAGLGIFGLVSFNVTRRTREIGVRMALGASRAAVVALIARSSLFLACVGLVLGVACSLLLTRLFANLLYEVSPADTLVFLAVAVLVFGATLLATWLPARRAAAVDPAESLRTE